MDCSHFFIRSNLASFAEEQSSGKIKMSVLFRSEKVPADCTSLIPNSSSFV